MLVANLLQFFFAGVVGGAIYAPVAVGLNIIFNATGAVNFAQGEFAMLGGMLGVSLLAGTGLPLPLVLLIQAPVVRRPANARRRGEKHHHDEREAVGPHAGGRP